MARAPQACSLLASTPGAAMSPICKEVPRIEDFVALLAAKGQDFWLSALVDITTDQMPDKMYSYRINDDLAQDVYSHCLFMKSQDVKTDADSLTDFVGLGMRKNRVRSKRVPGCIFVFVNESGPSSLMKQRADLPDDDSRLSTEERLRRTTMSMEVTSEDGLVAELSRTRRFWITCWQGLDAEEGKKKAVGSVMENQPATERFKRCLFAEVQDCQQASVNIEKVCGMGLRSSRVRSKSAPGVVAVFLVDEAPAARSRRVAAAPVAATPESKSGPSKKRRLDIAQDGPLLPIEDAGSPQKAARTKEAARPARGKAASADSEDLYFRQVLVLEKRMGELLPSLPVEMLATPYVQAKLEDLMQKPHGRFDKFKTDIARIWRCYLESRDAQIPDLD